MPLRASLRPLSCLFGPGLAAAIAALVTGCGTPCERLVSAMCADGPEGYCAQVDAWMQTRLVDPETKQPLEGAARDQMCSAIHNNVEMFHAYGFKAKQKILGEPEFILASQKKAEEEARAYEESKAAAAQPKPEEKAEDGEEEARQGGANMSD